MSSLLKYRHAGRDYGEAVVTALIGDTSGHVTLGGHPLHWRSVHHSIDGTSAEMGPHMDEEDWWFESANDVLARLVETMVLWSGKGHVAKYSDAPAGLNLVDLAIDHADNASFDDRSLRYVRRELEQELFRRYLQHRPLQRVAFVRLGIKE